MEMMEIDFDLQLLGIWGLKTHNGVIQIPFRTYGEIAIELSICDQHSLGSRQGVDPILATQRSPWDQHGDMLMKTSNKMGMETTSNHLRLFELSDRSFLPMIFNFYVWILDEL